MWEELRSICLFFLLYSSFVCEICDQAGVAQRDTKVQRLMAQNLKQGIFIHKGVIAQILGNPLGATNSFNSFSSLGH